MKTRQPMTEGSFDDCVAMAVHSPAAFGIMSIGQFVEQFGIPNGEQWADLLDVLTYDAVGRLRSRFPLSLQLA